MTMFPKPTRRQKKTPARLAYEAAIKKQNKYGAKRSDGRLEKENLGYSFASGLEAALFTEYLRPLELAGQIRDLRPQPQLYLEINGERFGYKPDFEAYDLNLGETVWYEAKGAEGERWAMIKKLWRAVGPGRLRVFKGSKTKFRMTEELRPNAWSDARDWPVTKK
jgi:hypothetical protein